MSEDEPDGRRHNRTDDARAARWASTWRERGWDIVRNDAEKTQADQGLREKQSTFRLVWRRGDGMIKWIPIEGLAAHQGRLAMLPDDQSVGVVGEDGIVHLGAQATVNGEVQTVTIQMSAKDALGLTSQIIRAVRAATLDRPLPVPDVDLAMRAMVAKVDTGVPVDIRRSFPDDFGKIRMVDDMPPDCVE